jgi:hypothetical protein
MGNPNDFSIKIFARESPFQVAEKMQTFIHLSGLEKDIWNYIERIVDQFRETIIDCINDVVALKIVNWCVRPHI